MSRSWYILGFVNFVGVLITLLVMFNVLGEAGYPKGADGGPANGPLTFGVLLLLLFGVLLCFVGMSGVITSRAVSAVDDTEFRGTKARIIGALQCLGGVMLIGGATCGLIFP